METHAPTKNVEMDTMAAHHVSERINEVGLEVVGWYHSHPKFDTTPSKIDIDNHFSYHNGINPNFIAAIINPSYYSNIKIDFF
jgi:proteasome lid subunit RPN8/RPN11